MSPLPTAGTIYFSTPIDQFCHPLYAPAVAAVRRRFPDAELFQPAKTGWSNADWWLAWQTLRNQISALVVWPRKDGSIGFGCAEEIRDARQRRLPVYVLSRDRRLFTLDRVEELEAGPVEERNWQRFARVVKSDEVK